MKKGFLFIALMFITMIGFSQVVDPASFTFSAKKKTANVYEVIMTVTLEKGWHIYSQNTGKGGPLPTKITFKANPLITLDGKIIEKGKLQKSFDENFKTNVLQYSNTVVFVQVVKVKAGIKTNITGNIQYMLCNDKSCLAPTKKTFDIKLN